MGRLRRMGERITTWPPAQTAASVYKRFNELGGGFMASAVTLSVFLALIPLLLVMVAALGFVSAGNDDVAADLIDYLGVQGEIADLLTDALTAAEEGRGAATIVGLLGLVWASLAIAGSIENVCNRAWQVPGRGTLGKLFGLGWLVAAVVLVGGSMAATGLIGVLPVWAAPVQVLLGIAMLAGFFLFTFRLLTTASVPWKAHVPGAIAAGVGFHALTLVARVIVPGMVASRSALYGSIGAVFALLAYLLLFGRLLVYSVVVNVVLHERAHGTVHVEVEAPRFEGEVPVAADRSAVIQR